MDGGGGRLPNRRTVGSGSPSFGGLVPGTAIFIEMSALHSLAGSVFGPGPGPALVLVPFST